MKIIGVASPYYIPRNKLVRDKDDKEISVCVNGIELFVMRNKSIEFNLSYELKKFNWGVELNFYL
jgi:hypothetical protein